MSEIRGARIHVTGVVQGVGFRPFVYGLATELRLAGWVRNTSAGVDIEVDGPTPALEIFVERIRQGPPLARVDQVSVELKPPDGFSGFEILDSRPIPDAFQPISADMAICPDCLRELFTPGDRRYRYPFINCTNCGPRFTIIQDIPYDRPKTTMAGFPMCPECAAEYHNPLDRRFHAQPVACPACGPKVWIEGRDRFPVINNEYSVFNNRTKNTDDCYLNTDHFPQGDAAIIEARRLLAEGKILAVKGLGGFHLACDATNAEAVAELRRRKLRVDKPFALMMPDLETVQEHCFIGEAERSLLESRERPIVILRRRPDSTVALETAPGQTTLGVMLPYTPLHYLLFERSNEGTLERSNVKRSLRTPTLSVRFERQRSNALVMTSGNLSEEPIVAENEAARSRLAGLADAFLMHDRPIQTRCDDSVLRVFEPPFSEGSPSDTETVFPLRRSRGYAPFPVHLPAPLTQGSQATPLLAAGAELKNTFCITRDGYAFLSHHIGDLENYETLQSFESGVAHFERLFRVQPEALAYDLHPNYLATRYVLERAQREGLPAIGVQHHHAHIAACMAEHGLPGEQPVIGVAFDGTGYGEDGAIWGGEFLLAGYTGYRRLAHLAYLPLPGGDASTRRPARIALAYLWKAGLDWDPGLPSVETLCAEERMALRAQLERNLNSPLTSSVGRLFDAAAALAGVRQKVSYEAQAAIEFEALAGSDTSEAYSFAIPPAGPAPGKSSQPLAIDPLPVIRAIAEDVQAGVPVATISSRFHNGVAGMVAGACRLLHSQTGVNEVVLSGGVWQNLTLLSRTLDRMLAEGFTVYIHRQVPTNDGGLALGQAVIAIQKMNVKRET